MQYPVILSFPKLIEGTLIKRYKRFLADIKLDNGEIVTAHCANTGPMKGVLIDKGRVRLRFAPSEKRKLSWTWEQSEITNHSGNKCWVGVNTSLANKLILKSIQLGLFKDEFGPISQYKTEVKYGKDMKSRIDILLIPEESNFDKRRIYIEVKNTTWNHKDIALFPDTITVRGQKHLRELMNILPHERGVLIPCISRNDMSLFAPGDTADKKYGELFREAESEGVEIYPCCFTFEIDQILWAGKRGFMKNQEFG